MIMSVRCNVNCQSCLMQDEAERGSVILMQDEAEIVRI